MSVKEYEDLDMEKLKKKKQNCKRSRKQTSYFCNKISLKNYKNGFVGYMKRVCDELDIVNDIYFTILSDKKHLSIFEAGILISMYIYNRVPKDYGGYFDCEKGEKFVEDLDKIIIFKFASNKVK